MAHGPALPTSKDACLQMWAPRVGVEAATHLWRRQWWFVSFVLGAILSVICLAAGLGHDQERLWIGGIVLAAVSAGVFGTLAAFERHAYQRAASAALGLVIVNDNEPPEDDDAYAYWCAQLGLTPNAVGEQSVD